MGGTRPCFLLLCNNRPSVCPDFPFWISTYHKIKLRLPIHCLPLGPAFLSSQHFPYNHYLMVERVHRSATSKPSLGPVVITGLVITSWYLLYFPLPFMISPAFTSMAHLSFLSHLLPPLMTILPNSFTNSTIPSLAPRSQALHTLCTYSSSFKRHSFWSKPLWPIHP